MDTKLTIKKERMIKAENLKVWNILTNPVNIEKWLGTKTTSDWKAGSPIIFSFTWNNKEYTDKGNILQLDHQKTFSYNYWSAFSGLTDHVENYSVITFALKSEDTLVKLTLTHSNFGTQEMYEHSDKNWEETLDTIKNLAEN